MSPVSIPIHTGREGKPLDDDLELKMPWTAGWAVRAHHGRHRVAGLSVWQCAVDEHTTIVVIHAPSVC